LTFLKGFETPLLNFGEMHKNIPLIVIAGYKAITLFLAEPLNGACDLHGAKNLLKNLLRAGLQKVRRPPFHRTAQRA
jgi:hypothetical protein